jgi:hypothetical protein
MMKAILIPLVLVASLLPGLGQTKLKTETSQHREGSSNGSQASSTSVTVTSDGKTTVKKTVTVIDGVRKVVIETTDENGETTRTESGGSPERENSDPWIGLKVSEVPGILRDQLGLAVDEGLAVELVASDGPAMAAGVQKGDLLLSVGKKGVASKEALSESLSSHQPGDEVAVVIMRKAKRQDLSIKLAAAPTGEQKVVPEGLLQGIEKSTIESVDVDVTGKGFESLLNNPDLPEDFKKTIREMQKSLREFEKKNK